MTTFLERLGQYTDLSVLTVSALTNLRTEAVSEQDALVASVTPDTVTDSQLDNIKTLREFGLQITTELEGRTSRAATFAQLTAKPHTDEPATPADDDVEEVELVPELVPAVKATFTRKPVRIADVPTPTFEGDVDQSLAAMANMTLVAAADVPGFSAGQELPTMEDLARAFLARTAGYASLGNLSAPVMHSVAVLRRDYPEEFQVIGQESDQMVLKRAGDESRLPGGSLLKSLELKRSKLAITNNSEVAAAGWCAPSETMYSVCFQGTTDGLLDAPEVQARRGGLRTNTGIDFGAVFGAGTGFFNLTEAQVIANTPKTCLEIPCPTFTDTRLLVNGVCLTGNILQNRGYPEYVAEFMRAAMVVHAHYLNQLRIAQMVTGSTAVNLGLVDPWISDGSVASQVMSAVELAIVDLKYRLRMQRSATIEIVLPFWVLAQVRADLSRRNAGDVNLGATDEEIMAWFRARGARPQFVYDWQDAFSGVVTGPGATTPPSLLPSTLSFLAYPAGTWISAVNDVITLNSVYDAAKLATNQLTQLFTEEGYSMIKVCPQSRVYTMPICPTGSTGAQRAIDCVTP